MKHSNIGQEIDGPHEEDTSIAASIAWLVVIAIGAVGTIIGMYAIFPPQ